MKKLIAVASLVVLAGCANTNNEAMMSLEAQIAEATAAAQQAAASAQAAASSAQQAEYAAQAAQAKADANTERLDRMFKKSMYK